MKKGLQFYAIRTSVGINEVIMRAMALVLALIATPALADVAGTASVIDGDTLEIHGQRIRFHGIDAPETIPTITFTCSIGGATRRPVMCGSKRWPCAGGCGIGPGS